MTVPIKAPVSDVQDVKNSIEKTHERSPSPDRGTVTPIDGNANTVLENLSRVDEAIDVIGFGKYQWQLTFTCSFGFLVDQMLLVSISLVTPQAAMEFGPRYSTLLSAPQYAGLLVGSFLFGILVDNIGRRLIWHISIFGVSVVILLAASANNWAALNVWVMLSGLFSGGNLAVDLSILAESIPRRWSFVLSGLAGIWGFGNAVTGLIAWPLLVNFGCPTGSTPENCKKRDNMGWRYLYIILGALCLIMSLIRAFVLRSKESPRWLITAGRIPEAVEVLNKISQHNHSDHVLTDDYFVPCSPQEVKRVTFRENWQRLASFFEKVRLSVGLCLMWALIGIAYPLYTIFLPYYLQSHGAKIGDSSTYLTYRDWAVSSVIGIFGPLLSMAMVSSQIFRSRVSIAITAAACIAFSGAFTTVKTEAQDLAFSCMINFWLNALYAVIYSYSPQVIDVQNRGVGVGLLMACGRCASLSAPFIATFADVTTSAPLWVSCGCYGAIGLIALAMPVDTEAYFKKN